LAAKKLHKILEVSEKQFAVNNYEMLDMLHHLASGFKSVFAEAQDKAFD